MHSTNWEYENTWRPSSHQLWAISFLVLLTGALIEPNVAGAFSASGGIVIAVTTPLFALAFAKHSAYELDSKLAAMNQKQEANLGASVYENLPDAGKPNVADQMGEADRKNANFTASYEAQWAFSRSLLIAQGWIISIASVVWAIGAWLSNLVFHCGELTC